MPIRTSAQSRSLNGAARFRPGWVPWLWVTLPVLAIISFYIYPFITTVYVSFTKTKPMGRIGRFVGIDNYAAVLGDAEFWEALRNSLIYAVCVVPLMVLLPLLLALLVKSHVPGIGFFRALYYRPRSPRWSSSPWPGATSWISAARSITCCPRGDSTRSRSCRINGSSCFVP